MLPNYKFVIISSNKKKKGLSAVKSHKGDIYSFRSKQDEMSLLRIKGSIFWIELGKEYCVLEESDCTTGYLIYNNFKKKNVGFSLDQPNRIMPTLTKADMPSKQKKK